MTYVATQPIEHDGRRYEPGALLDFEPSEQLLASGSVAVVEAAPEPEAKPKPKRGSK